MITIQKEIPLSPAYPLERIGQKEELLFFDIETTGFSGDSSQLYLIGCVFFENGAWQLIQWFADTADTEPELLHAFFGFLKRFRILIHFNGDGFDIPFLLKRCRALRLDYSFDGIASLDIYRKIKPYKKLLGLESLKQKSIEHFLNIRREDPYTGGQLIEVYSDYLVSHDNFLYRLLMLHNEDDLKGMPAILPILSYPDFLEGAFSLTKQAIRSIPDFRGRMESEAVLTYESAVTLPVPFETLCDPFRLEFADTRITVTVPLLEGELKHFYEDYQNYYYLIYEDQAIHKSVGQYVEKEARRKATAKTCYTRASGLFLPQPGCVWSTCLKADYKDKLTFVPYCEDLFSNAEDAERYLLFLLEKAGARR